MSSFAPLGVECDGDTIRITMNRPERHNALAADHLLELRDAFAEAGRSDATGIVLGADGPVFSAGHDFADVAARELTGVRELLELCTELMRTIQSVPQVVVARVHALATAAGCQLVTSCDLAVAAESAGFALPGGKGGWFCHTPAVPVARAVGRKRLMEMALTGDVVDAPTRARMGPGQSRGARRRAGRRGRRAARSRDPRQSGEQGARQADALRAARPS